MMRAFHLFLVIAYSITIAVAAEAKHTYRPPAGYVPDAATAIKIAVAIWEPIYGAKLIASEKPFRAALHNGVWTVTGSLPKNIPGGVAVAEISKKDGTILRVSHSK
jgi:NTF2 fold immunity protein